jgi:LysR family nitrogen assimilation transcriptional regulator
MELETLRLLISVADQGSFTRAATKTGMTQSALSRQVQGLEREFNARLLYRDGRGVKLTEAGRKLVGLGKQIFQSVDELKEDLLVAGSRFRGTIALGLPPSFGSAISAALVRRFSKDYPEAQLRVVVAYSGALADWLEAGRIDVAVLYDVHRTATLLVTPLLTEYLYLVQGASGAQSQRTAKLSELGEGTYVVPSSENGVRKIMNAAAAVLNIEMKIVAEVDSLDATKELVETGAERCVLPYSAVHREVKAGRLAARRFDDARMQALLVLATPLHKPVTKLASAVLQLVEKEVERFFKEGVLAGVVP